MQRLKKTATIVLVSPLQPRDISFDPIPSFSHPPCICIVILLHHRAHRYRYVHLTSTKIPLPTMNEAFTARNHLHAPHSANIKKTRFVDSEASTHPPLEIPKSATDKMPNIYNGDGINRLRFRISSNVAASLGQNECEGNVTNSPEFIRAKYRAVAILFRFHTVP